MSATVHPIMQFGATGPVVADFQRMLTAAGFYPGENLGVYDSATTEATKAFQQREGLAVTGDADRATITALERCDAALGSVEETPPDNVIQLPVSPKLVETVKQAAARPPSEAMVPRAYPVVVASEFAGLPSQPFYKHPLFITAAIIGGTGILLYAIAQMNAEQPFESFEDAEGLDPAVSATPEPLDPELVSIAEAAKALKRRPRRRAKRAAKPTAPASKKAVAKATVKEKHGRA